ncbi:restriction modification system DNA specificity domain protein [Halothece sp. PCC 7418]|uniref:restriction endonuclease subunit S n=1 Tax=Halothece sp. (strain PCC 7418) TaxID=65093 RepID=UPI0002A08231|nr:restriction endonuclease subunit S [Halothece sp. PCC 7418]AFZ45142.1 restriction modification system DNA specificity domain protein [Halothece sp. PCC 7418]
MEGQEVKEGYKLTEVGVIPEDWEIKKISEIAEVKGGRRLPKGKSLIDKKTQHPYIKVSDMFEGGILLDHIKYVPNEIFPLIKNYRIYQDDLFISVAGTLGIVGKIPTELNGANLTENADRLTNIKCNKDFLLYQLLSSRIQTYIESVKTVGAQPKLALSRIEEFKIPLPPTKKEQEKIAQVLSDVDSAIAHLDKLIHKKRNLKQGTMQQLLTGKKRLPGFCGEWEVKKLGDLVEVVMGQSPDSKTYNTEEKGVPLIQGNADISNRKTIKRVWTSQVTKLCNQGDVIMTVRAPIGAIGIASYDSCLGRGACSFKAKNINKLYFFYLMIFKEATWETIGQGSTFTAVNSNDIFNFPLFVANSLPEQKQIAQILTDMDAEIEALEKKRDKYKAIKQGMMQELLTGKTRLIPKS